MPKQTKPQPVRDAKRMTLTARDAGGPRADAARVADVKPQAKEADKDGAVGDA